MKVGIIPYPFSALGFGRDPFGQIVSGEFDLFLTLFQEDNIRRDLGSGERLKRRVRQTDSADKLRAPCDILPYGFVVFIERPFRSDKGDDTARLHKIERFRYEEIVNQKVFAVVARIVDLDGIERDVADGNIKAVILKPCRFVAAHLNIRFGV